jgi:hypothetical protein
MTHFGDEATSHHQGSVIQPMVASGASHNAGGTCAGRAWAPPPRRPARAELLHHPWHGARGNVQRIAGGGEQLQLLPLGGRAATTGR